MLRSIRIGRRTIRMRHFLVTIGVLCGLGILAGTLVLLERDRQSALQAEDARGLLLASVLESHVSRTLSSVDNSLNAIHRMLLLPTRDLRAGMVDVDVQALLDTISSSSTHLRSVSILNAGGRVLSSSNRENIGRRFSLTQLGFSHEISDTLENGHPLFVRDLHELDDSTDAGTAGNYSERGVYVLPFAMLVKVGGANLTLLALVNPAYLFPDHRNGPREDAGYEALFDYQGMVLAATPDAPFTVGSRHVRLPMFDMLNNDQEFGHFGLIRRDAKEADGTYLVNFRASRNFPLAAVIGLSEERALSSWEGGAHSMLLMGLSAALLALLYAAALHKTMLAGERTREELHRAKEAAEQADAAKSRFLSTMSHEIRTPMNGVLGMAALLRDTPLNAQQQEFARTIEESGQALMSIINDILDFSKIEAGHMGIEAVECPLLPLAEGCIDTLMGRAVSRGLALVSFVDPALPAVVRADRGRIRQILLNLIDNAVKFTPAGEVALNVSLQERANGICRVRFEVSDSGIGIEAQAMSRLFQPFMQADSSVTRKYGGTGLGLSICKRLLELMDSAIEVDSKPGHGTTFRFELELQEVAGPAAIPSLPPERALVLTPLPRHAAAVAAYLRAWGMQPHCAASEEEALQLLDAASHALAVIDARMPHGHGSAQMLASRQPGLRLLQLADNGEAQEAAVRQGFHATLRRPLRQTTLHEAVTFALERRHYMTPAAQGTQADNARQTGGTGDNAERAGGKLVLLVEDNLTNQKVALHQLTRLGYAAHVASNGEEALQALALHRYALILMDCQMPLLDGFEATRRIRAAERISGGHVPVVAMTANAAEGDRERCLEAGMDDYLAKPIVREALAALLEQRAPLGENRSLS